MGGKTFIDFYTEKTGYINTGTGVINNLATEYGYVIISVKEGDSFSFTTNGVYYGYFGFLSAYNEASLQSTIVGELTRVKSASGTVPSGAIYLYLTVKYNNNSADMNLVLNGVNITEKMMGNFVDLASKNEYLSVNKVGRFLLFNEAPEYDGYINFNGSKGGDSKWKYKVIPVNEGDIISFSVSNNVPVYYAFFSAFDISTGATVVSYHTTQELSAADVVVPTGTKYFYTQTKSSNHDVTFGKMTINTIIDAILNAIPLLLQGAIQFFMAIIQAIPTIIITLVQELPKIITTIIETLLSRLPDLIMGAIQLFMGIIQAIPTIIIELVKALPQIIVALVKGLISGVGELAKAGLELMKGLVQGIGNAAKFVWDKIKSFCSGIVDKIKGFFGIHSPSTLFRDQIGENMALGIPIGFDDEMGTVTDDMVDSLDDMTKAMETHIESNGISGAETISGDTNIGGSTIAINVYGAEGQNVDDLAQQVAYRLEDLTRRKEAAYA